MDVNLKVLFIFFLLRAAAMGKHEPDTMSPESPRQFHVDQNNFNRKILKSEINKLFVDLRDQLISTDSENFWKTDTVNDKLDTLEEKITKMERNLERVMTNLSRTLNNNEKVIVLSEPFRKKPPQNESHKTENLRRMNEALQWNHHQLLGANISELPLNLNPTTTAPTTPFIVTSQTEKLYTYQKPTPTEVEIVNAQEGTIEFTGGTNFLLRRKVWVIQMMGGSRFYDVFFNLEQNNLEANDRLSIWGSGHPDGKPHVWNGSQRDWREERETSGNVIVVTLTISPSAVKQPAFKLKFRSSRFYGGLDCSNEIVSKKGNHVVSFPRNNTEDYPLHSLFVAVIAPPIIDTFQLTLKYLDLPGSPPDSCENMFFVWFLDESHTGDHYKLLNSCAYRRCGNVGNISEPLGNASIAIIQFANTPNWSVGRGFSVEVNAV